MRHTPQQMTTLRDLAPPSILHLSRITGGSCSEYPGLAWITARGTAKGRSRLGEGAIEAIKVNAVPLRIDELTQVADESHESCRTEPALEYRVLHADTVAFARARDTKQPSLACSVVRRDVIRDQNIHKGDRASAGHEEGWIVFQIAPNVPSQEDRLHLWNKSSGNAPADEQVINFLSLESLVGIEQTLAPEVAEIAGSAGAAHKMRSGDLSPREHPYHESIGDRRPKLFK